MLRRDLWKLVCSNPVAVSIRINDCIKQYSSGVITDFDNECGCTSNPYTNHAVTIVGYGRDYDVPHCEHYWLVKNSWGEGWGENGYMRVCADDDMFELGTCNIRTKPIIPIKY